MIQIVLKKINAKRLIILAVLLIGVLLFLRGRNTNTKVQYQTATATKGTIVSTVSASGKVLSSNFLTVNTSATGVVSKVYVKDGDKVYRGQKIAQITFDSDGALANVKAWASLTSAQVALNSANNNYRSTQASLQNVYDQIKGHDSDETFEQKELRTKAEVANDNAYDNLKTAKANLASAGLSYTSTSSTIVAPNSGVVDNVTVTPGMVLASESTTGGGSMRVAVIQNSLPAILSFNLSEIDVPRVKLGQKATVTLDSISDKTFTGKIVSVDRIGTVVSNVTSYPAIIQLDTTDNQILPNMATSASIIIDTKSDVLIVPSTSVQDQNGETIARTLKNGIEVDVPVETGLVSDTETEIVSGLSEGDEVITGIINPSVVRTTSVFSTGFGGRRGN